MTTKARRRTQWIAVLLLAAGLCAPAGAAMAQGSGGNAWTAPINLSASQADSLTPAIAADPSGAVHVFWAEDTDPANSFTNAIFYARWDGTSWSQPVDVLISPEGASARASDLAVAADADGRLHLVWAGGWGGSIYYSSALASEARSANGWKKPVALNPGGAAASAPDLALDGQGVLHVVFPVQVGVDQGIYYVQSTNGGSTWSDPILIPGTRLGSDTMLDDLRLAAGPDGTIHAVWNWSVLPDTYPPKGIYYARSTDSGRTWSDPWPMADGPFAFPDVATVGEREVHAVWSGTSDQRSKFHRWSADGGTTWTATAAVLTPGGFQGYADMAVDSAGTLHWVTVTSHKEFHDPLVHLTWAGATWRGPDILLSSPGLGLHDLNQNIAYAAVAVSEGNLLRVVTVVPQPLKDGYQFDIFYVSGRADAPWVAPSSIETPPLTPAAADRPTGALVVATAVRQSEPAPVSSPTLDARQPQGSSPATMENALLIGLVPALLVMAIAVIAFLMRSGGRDWRG